MYEPQSRPSHGCLRDGPPWVALLDQAWPVTCSASLPVSAWPAARILPRTVPGRAASLSGATHPQMTPCRVRQSRPGSHRASIRLPPGPDPSRGRART